MATNNFKYANWWQLKDRIDMAEQSKYKYIINIEGNSAAYRLSYLLKMGSLILNVKSENTLWWESIWETI